MSKRKKKQYSIILLMQVQYCKRKKYLMKKLIHIHTKFSASLTKLLMYNMFIHQYLSHVESGRGRAGPNIMWLNKVANIPIMIM